MGTSGEANDAGYLFGCCAACRAPFVPTDARFFASKHTQTVLFLVAKFKEISNDTMTPSEFSGTRQKGHIVTQSHVRPAFEFARGLDVADIDNGIPGWSAIRRNVRFDARSFRMVTGARPGRGRALENEGLGVADSMMRAVREVRERAADGADPDEVDRDIIRTVSNASGSVYRACWDAPNVRTNHREAAQWLQDNDFRDYVADLNRTVPMCHLCNGIWDCFSRMSLVLRDSSVIPPRSIEVIRGNADSTVIPDNTSAQVHTYRLGCMVAYYLHGCLRQFLAAVPAAEKWTLHNRDAYVALGLLPLHAHCMYEEMNQRAAGAAFVKGAHNYLGCLDLIISQYLYVMASIDAEHAFAGFPFERFHVLYMKELAECPAPVWDPRLPRVHDYVFDDGYRGEGTIGGKVSYASLKLLRLYTDVVKPLVNLVVGDVHHAPSVEASRFFLTRAEADALVEDYLRRSAANIDNLKVHLDRAGSCAILWQLQRGVRSEDEKYQREIGLWLRARMHAEWKNIAANQAGKGISMREAQVIYLLMHTRDPHADLPALTGPTEGILDLAEQAADDAEDALDAMRSAGRCSMWKAAHRLRAWNFTREAPPRPMVLEDELDDDEDDSDGGGNGDRWRVPGRLRSRRGVNCEFVSGLVEGLAALAITSSGAAAPTARRSEAVRRRQARLPPP